MVRTACQAGVLGLVLRGRGEHINRSGVATRLSRVELAVRNVHQHVIASLRRTFLGLHQSIDGSLEMRYLLGCLGFAKVFLGEQILGFSGFGFNSRLFPRFCSVVALVQRGCLVVKRLQLLLGFLGYRGFRLLDVVRRCLERIRAVGISQRVDSHFPIAGTIGVLGQLATGRIGKAQLDAHGLVHPVVSRELGAETAKRLRIR